MKKEKKKERLYKRVTSMKNKPVLISCTYHSNLKKNATHLPHSPLHC